jgi:dTDP-4-dehydrorhamnose 3,5-epimerase-like enzyme
MSLVEWIDFRVMGDHRGSLVAVEAGRTIPFEIRRIYYLFGTQPNVPRGFHAHRALLQLAVCVSGSCRIVLDDGARQEEAMLDRPDRGLLIPKMVWREMHDFSPDCVLLVLASEYYDEADYIRDYEKFRILCGGKG